MPSDLLKLIRLSRLFDAAFPVVSLLLGAAVVGQLNSQRLFLLVAVVVILNSVAMIWNDIEDRRVDADNGRPELITTDSAVLQRLKIYVVMLAGLSLLIAWLANSTAFFVAIATLGVIWLYNSKPVQASRRPVLSIVVLSGAGAFLPYLFGLSLGNIEASALAAGIFWWVGRISLSALKDYKDARGDARHHKKTFLLCYGARKVAWVSATTFLAGYIGFIAIVAYSAGTTPWILPVLIAAIGMLTYVRWPLFRSKSTYGDLDNSFRKIAQYQLFLDAGVVLWLI
ncbi:MAG: hypothetical protein UY35_C0026G0003 [Candidatus Saccharibacteria bacterium GW2011_GWC2_48_9]|nr:MAG: hypothetical protein UY35_C0026G0003 [Candidatus Saccharibacteria bacterium GW2011_GWC2_48_9]HCH34883.1 hypothetical protein [Candidatus Saccharibacteria bacterium]